MKDSKHLITNTKRDRTVEHERSSILRKEGKIVKQE